jgi:uncharacterized Zn finger protein
VEFYLRAILEVEGYLFTVVQIHVQSRTVKHGEVSGLEERCALVFGRHAVPMVVAFILW